MNYGKFETTLTLCFTFLQSRIATKLIMKAIPSPRFGVVSLTITLTLPQVDECRQLDDEDDGHEDDIQTQSFSQTPATSLVVFACLIH